MNLNSIESFSKYIAVVIILIVIAAFSGGCGRSGKLPPRLEAEFASDKVDVLRLGLYGDVLSLSPIAHHGEYERFLCNLIHAAPLKRDSDGKLKGDLFDNWVCYPDEDGHLIVDGVWKRDLHWHDGTPFEGSALAFTIEAMKKIENSSPYASLASRVVKIDDFDRGKRVRIVFATQSRRNLEILTAGLLPPHLLAAKPLPDALVPRLASDPDATPSKNASASSVPYTEYPVGIGPYRLVNRQRGKFMELEAWSQTASVTVAPNFSRILVRCYGEFDTLLSDFRNGKLDWMPVPSEIAARLEELKLQNVRFVRYLNPALWVWGFNMRKAPLDRLEVRTALDECLDRESIKSKIPYEGQLLRPSGAASQAHDLAKALDALQIIDANGDGVRDYSGKPFNLKILVNEENLLRKLLAEEIARQLKSAGVNASVEAVNWSELLEKRLPSNDWETFLLAFQEPPDGNAIDLWHSVGSATGSLNFCGISDKELDEALERLDAWPELAPASAAELRAVVDKRLEKLRPAAFLFRPFDVVLCSENLMGPASETCIIDMQPANWKKFKADIQNLRSQDTQSVQNGEASEASAVSTAP